MRLFIAVNFSEDTKKKLSQAQELLRAACSQQSATHANFTRTENLHLTLVFLGETAPERVSAVTEAMNSLRSPAFTLVFDGLGCFQRDIWWIGVEKNPQLTGIYNDLSTALAARGFAVETRPYTPHLTLARKLRLDSARVPTVERFTAPINHISLMLSERVSGVLTYTELARKELHEGGSHT